MTTLDHLRNLVRIDPIDCCESKWANGSRPHTPDCPWVAAKKFVEAASATETWIECPDCGAGVEVSGPRGFTLIELLVVLVIILLVSAVALPTVLSALSHRQVSEGARILQAQLAGARDAAIRDNALSGIRLLPDPTTPNACNRFIPLSQPPDYSNGLVTINPTAVYTAGVLLGTQALVLEEQVTDANGLPNEPTSWFWNVRQGDRIQIDHAGPWLTVCGPVVAQNPECFVNCGPPGTLGPLGHDYLLLVNGYDDNQNGWIDEGFDGFDNNQQLEAVNGSPASIDESSEWEAEAWKGAHALGLIGATYAIRRRPLPGINARETPLPSNVVVDMARSNLPASLDLLCSPDGRWSPSLQWGLPSSIAIDGNWLQFWLSERADIGAPPKGQWFLVSLNGRTGKASSIEAPDLASGLALARQE